MARLASQLRRATVELAHLEKQLSRLEARTAGKRLEVAKLEAAIAKDGGTSSPRPTKKRARRQAPEELPARRTDAIVEILAGESRAMSPTEVVAALHRRGREDDLRTVSATLAHLLKANRVERVARGRYVCS
jgi:hypothetical protein